MTDQQINEAVARKLGINLENLKARDYCHSIEAAWEIVEYCRNDIKTSNEFQWALFEVTGSSDDSFEIFDITPMAICKAFLKLP